MGAKSDFKKGCFVSGKEWFYNPTRQVNEGSKLAKDQQYKDTAFALLGMGEAEGKRAGSVTPSDLIAADVENAEFIAASTDFVDELFEFEEALLKGTNLEPLRVLLETMPVAHVDRYSAQLNFDGEPLLERCAFRKVAALVMKMNLGSEAAGWVDAARSQLTSPSRDRVLGKAEYVDEFFAWVEGGKTEAGIPESPCETEKMVSPASASEACLDWLKMMANEHECDAEGNPSEEGDDGSELWTEDTTGDTEEEEALLSVASD